MIAVVIVLFLVLAGAGFFAAVWLSPGEITVHTVGTPEAVEEPGEPAPDPGEDEGR